MGYGNGYIGTGQDTAAGLQRASLEQLSKTCAPIPTSGVNQQMARLENLASELHQMIRETENRLGAVLQPEPPMPADVANKAMHSPVGLVQQLGVLGDSIAASMERLGSINRRIDL